MTNLNPTRTAREIKFRAWKKDTKEMYQIKYLDCDKTEEDNEVVMQFTGLEDKNGKEIYEGDLVEIDWKDERYRVTTGKVEWSNKEAMFYFGAGTPGEVGWSHKVIGNIYENPELLEENA